MVELRGSRAGAVRSNGFEEGHHGARRLLGNYLVDGGRLLEERDAVGVFDFADEARGDAQAVVGKHGVGGHLLLKRDFDGADGDRQIGRNGG